MREVVESSDWNFDEEARIPKLNLGKITTRHVLFAMGDLELVKIEFSGKQTYRYEY